MTIDLSKITPIVSIDFNKLIGGYDSRIAFQEEQEDPSMMFWSDCKNVEVYNGLLRKMNGCTDLFTTSLGVPILGGHNYYVSSVEYLVFNGGDGNFYLYDGFGGYTAKDLTPIGKNITKLSTTAKCQYTQFFNYIIVCNGVDEMFAYDITTDLIVETNFTAQAATNTSPIGYCSASFMDRLWVADGSTLYYSDIATPSEWRNDPTGTPPKLGGYIQNAGWGDSDKIESIQATTGYLLLRTKRKTYIVTMDAMENPGVQVFDDKGICSRFGSVSHDKNNYFFCPVNTGVYSFGQATDIGTFRTLDPVSRRITSTIAAELDLTNLNNLYIVSYPNRNQFWMYIPTIDGKLQTCYVFDFNYHSPNSTPVDFVPIYRRVGNPITCAFTYNNQIYTGTSTGQIQKEDSGVDFSGNVLDWFVYLPYISFGTRSKYKRCSDVKLWVSTTKVNKFKIAISYNQNSWKRKIKAVNIPIPDVYFILDSTLVDSTSLLELADEKSKRIGMGKEFTSVQIGFTGTSTNSDDIALRALSFIGVAEINRV